MDHSVMHMPERRESHRTLVIVIALVALGLLALIWLLAAPAAGALVIGALAL